jgi:hypothetical protein
MTEYDNEKRGALFKNRDKAERAGQQDTEKWPDYKGNIEIEGVKYWLSAWLSKSHDGMTYMSLRAVPKEARNGAGNGERRPRDEFGDRDMPF